MKTTFMTIALALGSMALMSAQTPAQTPAPAANTNKPAATTTAKTTTVKKHHKKVVKKSGAAAKTPAAPAAAAKPVSK